MANTAIPRDDAGRLGLLRHLNATLPGMTDLPVSYTHLTLPTILRV